MIGKKVAYAMTIDKKILDIMKEKERINSRAAEVQLIKKLRITREALEKLNLYSRFVSEITEEDIECRGALLNYMQMHDDITRDVYLEPGQDVTPVAAKSEDFNKIIEIRQAVHKENKNICGIWHSHGDMGTFHSDKDDIWLDNLYNTNKLSKIELGKINCEYKTAYENGILKIKIGDKLVTVASDGRPCFINAEQVIERKFVNSLVVNRKMYLNGMEKRGESYYAECVIESRNGDKVKAENLEIEIVEENNRINKDIGILLKECGERVTYKGELLKDHENYSRVFRNYIGDKVEKKPKIKKKHKPKLKKQKERLNRKLNCLQEAGNKAEANEHSDKTYDGSTRPNSIYKDKIKFAIGDVCIYAAMGFFALSVVVLSNIERISLNELNKTRPDVAYMIKEGRPFHEISKQYFRK